MTCYAVWRPCPLLYVGHCFYSCLSDLRTEEAMLQQQRHLQQLQQRQQQQHPQRQLPASLLGRAAHRTSVAAAAAKGSKKAAGGGGGSKGFGAASEKQAVSDGCPCGSGKHFKECCKPYLTGTATAPTTVEGTIRARFSAILKKDVSFLLRTTAPEFHTFMYGTEPGGALRTLQDDLWNTVEHYEYSNLKIRTVEPGDKPEEAVAVFQYTVYDQRTPLIDDKGNKARKVQIEQSRFVQNDQGTWQFADFKLVEVPEAMARIAEMQAKDMAAAAQEKQQQQAQLADGGATA